MLNCRAVRQAKLAHVAIGNIAEFIRQAAGQLVAAQGDPLQIGEVAQLQGNLAGELVTGEPEAAPGR